MHKDESLPERSSRKPRGLPTDAPLYSEIRELIEETRVAVAVTVNTGLTMLYWNVGKRIREEILKSERAEDGKKIVQSLSAQLTAEFGRGWSARNINSMIQFSEILPEKRIAQAVTAQLTCCRLLQRDPISRNITKTIPKSHCSLKTAA